MGSAGSGTSLEERTYEVLSRLEGVTESVPGQQWLALCPCHGDERPSLSIGVGEGEKLMMHCFAGCQNVDILRVLNLPFTALFPDRREPSELRKRGRGRPPKLPDGKIVATYPYTDAAGNLLYEVVRYEPKNFKQRRPGPGGRWEWKTVPASQRVPYRLKELAASTGQVVVGEGEKDADNLAKRGFTSTSNSGGAGKWTKKLAEPLFGRPVVIFPDNDDAGRNHAVYLAKLLHGKSPVKIVPLNTSTEDEDRGADVSDWLLIPGNTAEKLQGIIDATPAWDPASADAAGPEQTPAPAFTDPRAAIEVTLDEFIMNATAVEALGSHPNVFKRGGELVQMVRDQADTIEAGIERSAGTPRIRAIQPGYLRELLTRQCFFHTIKKVKGEEVIVQAPIPSGVVGAIHTRGDWPGVRYLSGITEVPIFRQDGSILMTPGWDPDTGLYFEPTDRLPMIQELVTRDDAIRARDLLLDIIQDFPFEKPEHTSGWLAALLTALGRRAFSGPAPLFLFDASAAGSGKSMLADLVANLLLLRDMPRMADTESDAEFRKRVTSLALAGDPLVLLDNLNGVLGHPSLDAALTSTRWSDRLLGTNSTVEMPLHITWMASGNNIALKGDTGRRVVSVRLQPDTESPEERTGFKYPRLLAHVREHRMELLAAGLTILRGFHVAGRPDAGLRPWGSFEGWSDLIRNTLVWIGLADPGANRGELNREADTGVEAFRRLVDHWHEVDSTGEGISAAELCAKLSEFEFRFENVRSALCEIAELKAVGRGDAIKIGHALKRFRGRVWRNSKLEANNRNHAKINRWRLVPVSAVHAVLAAHPHIPAENEHFNSGENQKGILNIENRKLPVVERLESSAASAACTRTQEQEITVAGWVACPQCGYDCPAGEELCAVCRRMAAG